MSLISIDPQLEQRRESLAVLLPLAFPISLNIESTNLCNLQCFFARAKKAPRALVRWSLSYSAKLLMNARNKVH